MSKDLAGDSLSAQVAELIGQELEEVEKIFLQELDSPNPYVTDVFAHVSRFRGKRLRPMLLLLSASAAGEINNDHKVLAAVVEMIHTATLVHDDVLDDATTRRHVATVNTRWNNETSVLFGDYLFTHAFHLASSLESTHACRLIGRATNIVCEGELSQIRERGNLDLSEQAYFKIIDAKTAELCAVSSRLGAQFANVDAAVIESFDRFGRQLGIAFQVADDLLDIVGNEQEAGKSLGTDFVQQKMTLPLIRLLGQSNSTETARIRELLTNPDEKTWTELSAFLEGCDAIEYAQSRALQHAAAARQCLECVGDSPAKTILEGITEFAVQRAY